MSKFADTLIGILFPMFRRNGSAEPQQEPSLTVTAEERARYAKRIEAHLNKAHRDRHEWPYDFATRNGFPQALQKLRLSTLKMLEEYDRPTEIGTHDLTYNENLLRSALFIGKQGSVHSNGLYAMMMATRTMTERYGVPEDITTMQPKDAEAVAAACAFMIETMTFEKCPPRVTAFVMERPDRLDDLLDYMKVRFAPGGDPDSIDTELMAEFLDSPAQPLRAGAL
jgi:hypothetical protein